MPATRGPVTRQTPAPYQPARAVSPRRVAAAASSQALPSAQRDLGISDANRQWIVTAYALAFGGLLLHGGRVADRWGRKNAFLTGLAGFALASALKQPAQPGVTSCDTELHSRRGSTRAPEAEPRSAALTEARTV